METSKILRQIAALVTELAASFTEPAQAESPKAAAAEPAQPSEPPKAAEPESISFDQLRALLTEQARSGRRDEMLNLMHKYGASKLSEIKPEDYAAIAAEVKCHA